MGLVPLIDSHCHLNADRFEKDAEAVLEAAQRGGLERILVPGWNVASSERALELAERHPWLDVAVGIPPHDAAKAPPDGWDRIARRAAEPRGVATGAMGRMRSSGSSGRPGSVAANGPRPAATGHPRSSIHSPGRWATRRRYSGSDWRSASLASSSGAARKARRRPSQPCLTSVF